MRARTGRASAILATSALLAVFVFAPATRAQVDPGSRAVSYLAAHQASDGSLDGSIGETEDLILGTAAKDALSDGSRATAALRYLEGALRSDGSLDGSAGATEDLLLGAAAAGYDPSTVGTCAGRSSYSYLAANVDHVTADAGATAKLILAVVAGRRDPRTFGGRDLLGRLDGFYDPATGRYGDGSTFGQSLAILALSATGRPVSAAAAAHLNGLQGADGGWNYQAVANGTAGDTNSTAIALMALAAVGDRSRVAAGLAWLHGQQGADGGFPYQAGPGATSDPDSDALVLEALTALRESPTAPSWTIGGHTVLGDISRHQAANGGFVFPGNSAPDAFTTSQVPMALERVPFPGTDRWTSGLAIPGRACPAAVTPSGGSTPPPTSTVAPPATSTTAPGWIVAILAAILGSILALRRPRRA
ncbi:MAG: prenyltransferase/squalene oxidase repeat-containing protein [Candidatus Limnocylindrales bacterium]